MLPPPGSRRRTRPPRPASLALLALLASLACTSSGRRLPGGPDAVRPTLKEIFLEPPISGDPPSLAGLSPDGAWALVRWNPAEREARRRRGLRLLAVADPAAPPGTGSPLAQLLPPPPREGGAGENGEDGDGGSRIVATWMHLGHRLAVGRGATVWLLDPDAPPPKRLLSWTLPEEVDEPEPRDGDDLDGARPEGAEGREPPGEEPAPKQRRLGEVRSLVFSVDDRWLRVSDGKELFEIPVPGEGEPADELALTEARWPSEPLEADAGELDWTPDLETAFGHDPVPRSEGETPFEVWHLDPGRGVTLEGMAAIEELDDASLSPDGRFVFGVEVDLSETPEPTIVPDYLTDRVTVRESRRRLADDRPPPLQLWMWSAESGERVALRLDPSNGEGEGLFRLRPIGWAPQPAPGSPARYAFERLSEDFRVLEIWCWSEGSLERLHVEADPRWIGGPARRTRWTADGARLVFGSETSPSSTTPGRSQLFALDPDGGWPLQLTEVAGEVSDFSTLGGGGVLFQASGEDPAQRGLGLVPRAALWGEDDAVPRASYPTPAGWCERARGSRDGERIVFLFERMFEPAEVYTADAKGFRRLTDTIPAAYREVPWVEPERIALRAPDGALVRAHVLLPPGTSLERPGPPRAAVVFVHGAGYLQNVTESMTRYPLNLMFHSRLASMGYPVVDVDYRGSAGYGNRFRTDVQSHLGGKDLDDIHLVVDELIELGVIDGERVGIYGGSYGGFMTLMALFTAPQRWTVGAALRSVTDWRTYHPGYTQPRLGRPSTHPEAYERSSPIDHAEKLEDPLLILHGLVDSNVFAQDSIRLIEELIDNELEFDAMLYPSQGHGFTDGEHWLDEYRRIEGFLLRHLGPPVRGNAR